MLFQTVLDRAHSRTFKLYQRVKDAPFLRDTGVEEHLRNAVGKQGAFEF